MTKPIISTAFLVMFTLTVLILHGCLSSCTGRIIPRGAWSPFSAVPTKSHSPTVSQLEAAQDGFTAYEHGASLTENPYTGTELASWWGAGYENGMWDDDDRADAITREFFRQGPLVLKRND